MSEEVAIVNPENTKLIRDMFAKGCTDNEFGVFMELANKYQLDPFSKQIWAVKYGNNPAQIFAGRDGYLAIAHRSGQFDGLQSEVSINDKGELETATAEVWRRDMSHSFKVTVSYKEYNSSTNPVWQSKPRTMLCKVAEAQALRKAFSVSGLYSPEEMEEPVRVERRKSDIDIVPVVEAINIPKEIYTFAEAQTVKARMEERGWSTSVIDLAKVSDDVYDKTMITESWNRQLEASKKPTEVIPKDEAKPKTVNATIDAESFVCSQCGASVNKVQADVSNLFKGAVLCKKCMK